MKKNRIWISMLVLAFSMGLLFGCGNADTVEGKSGEKISIVCTVFPQYDWVKQVIKEQEERFDVTLLLDNGTDLHNYQPTASDMVKIADCDVLIYVGGESDEWVEDAIEEAVNPNMQVIDMMEILGDNVKEEEVIEGMQTEEEHEEEEEETEYDEHIWLSLKNAEVLVKEIAQVIAKVDTEQATVYINSGDAYAKALSDLDAQYENVVETAKKSTILFGDRFPFRYLVDDYHLSYYAAFVGCSAETEASFETVAFLAGKMDELDLSSVLVLESADKKIAQSVIDNTRKKDMEILTLNSMQSVTEKDVAAGVTYLGIMKDNLDVLKQALN